MKNKLKALQLLKKAGIDDEKKLAAIDFEEIIKMPGMNMKELTLIAEIKKNVKNNRLYSYLMKEEVNIHNEKIKIDGTGNYQ